MYLAGRHLRALRLRLLDINVVRGGIPVLKHA